MSACSARIVASQAFENQTGNISSTSVLTTEGKLYRISAYLELILNANTHTETQTVGASISYNDESVSGPYTLNINVSNGQAQGIVNTIRGASGQSISVSATISAGTTTTYNFYVTVEEL